MANRHLLAVNKLEEFKNWLIENNWKIEKTKGNYEVLRARKSTEKLPLIVYKKDKDGLIHLSVSDWNTKYVYEFINDNKSNKQTDLKSQLNQQKEMWNELKEFVNKKDLEYYSTLNNIGFNDKSSKFLFAKYNFCGEIKNKIKELEKGSADGNIK